MGAEGLGGREKGWFCGTLGVLCRGDDGVQTGVSKPEAVDNDGSELCVGTQGGSGAVV